MSPKKRVNLLAAIAVVAFAIVAAASIFEWFTIRGLIGITAAGLLALAVDKT